jgi:ankyrin repeat protein
LKAAAWGHTSRLLVLLNAGANVNVRGDNGDTPLLLAAAYGHADTVEALLALGADINAKNDTGNTALIEAVASARLEIVKILIENKADVKARNVAGSSAVDVAREKARPDIRQLLTKRAYAKSLRYFNSPAAIASIVALHEAALEGNTQRITSLLAQGSDLNARDANGRTALMIAASTNKTKVVDLLLAKGANPNMTDYKQGRTALITAAEAGYDEVARSLLNGGANPNLKDRFGETAMSSAQRLNRLHIGRLLKQAGVNTPSYDQILPRP